MPHIGLQRGAVQLVPYSAEWPRLFQEEKARLQAALGREALDIQHVGSTSIPGMVAKPIIDIAIAVASFKEAMVCVAPIEGLGYEYHGENGIPRRHFFVKGNPRTYHLHMLEQGSPEWENHLLFRDHLIRHPDCAAEYAALKTDLARRFENDRKTYTDEKAPFILRVLQLARSEPKT